MSFDSDSKIKKPEEEDISESLEEEDNNEELDSVEEEDDNEEDYEEEVSVEEVPEKDEEVTEECMYDILGDDVVPETVSEFTYVDPDKRITKNRLTFYERVRLISERKKQLDLGAKPLIKNYELFNSNEIAESEIVNKVIPLSIIRPLPDNTRELWKINEFV